MKKIYLTLILITLSLTSSFAQLKKGDLLLNLYGNYVEDLSTSGVMISHLTQEMKTLNSGISAGIAVSKSWVIGLGLEYAHQKNNQDYSFINYSSFATKNIMETQTSIIAPLAFAKYYKKTFSRIYLGLNIEANYSFAEADMNSIAVTTPVLSGDITAISSAYIPIVREQAESNSSEILNLMLQPEVNFYLTKKLGLSVKIGGVRYTSFDSDNHEWHISLNPNNWEYGLFLRFGKK